MQWDDLAPADRPAEEEAKRLDVVRQFDHAARVIIRYLLGGAVEDLPEDTREWARRAQAAGAEGVDIVTIRRLILASGPVDIAQRQKEGEIRKWRERLEEMNRFLSIAKDVRDDLENRLTEVEQSSFNIDN